MAIKRRTKFVGKVRGFDLETSEISIDRQWYKVSSDLYQDAVVHCPVGTYVNVEADGHTIISLSARKG